MAQSPSHTWYSSMRAIQWICPPESAECRHSRNFRQLSQIKTRQEGSLLDSATATPLPQRLPVTVGSKQATALSGQIVCTQSPGGTENRSPPRKWWEIVRPHSISPARGDTRCSPTQDWSTRCARSVLEGGWILCRSVPVPPLPGLSFFD